MWKHNYSMKWWSVAVPQATIANDKRRPPSDLPPYRKEMKYLFFEGCYGKWGFWFRIKGYGLHVKLAKGHQPLFSERYGYTKPLYIFGLRIEILRPYNEQP